jgi:hypothetical protein
VAGEPGPQGLRGQPGLKGEPGKDGKNGKDGKDVDENRQRLMEQMLREIRNNTNLIPPIPALINKNSPSGELFKQGVAAGTCRTTKPGGCMSRLVNPIQQGVSRNESKLNGLNAAMNAAQFPLLKVINSKLGSQMTGGIAGKFGRLSNWLKLPQLLNILIYANTVITVSNLVIGAGDYAADTASLGLASLGIKDDEGNPINVQEVLGKSIENLLIDFLGRETYKDLSAKAKASNRVYQSSANIVSSVTSIVDSTRNIAEFNAELLIELRNAHIKSGVVREDDYRLLSPYVSAAGVGRNRLQRMVDGAEGLDDAASALNGVTSDVYNIVTEVGELKKQQKEFNESVEKLKETAQKEKQAEDRNLSRIPEPTESDMEAKNG